MIGTCNVCVAVPSVGDCVGLLDSVCDIDSVKVYTVGVTGTEGVSESDGDCTRLAVGEVVADCEVE